jgi:hypothetical protein
MTGTDWGDERAPNEGTAQPAPGDQSSAAQQPETLTFGTPDGSGPRRQSKRGLIAALSSVAAVVVVVVVVVLVTAGSGQTPAQALTAAIHNSAGYSSISASINEKVSGLTSASITGKVEVQRSPLKMSMKLSEDASGEHVPISAILTDSAMYLKLGIPIGLPAADNGKWIELRFSQLGALSSFGSLLHTLQNENPMSQVQALIGAKDVHAAGTQNVGGVQATKYTGTFSPAAAIKLLPAKYRSALAPELKQITGHVGFSIWINAGQIVQVTEVEHVMTSAVTVSIRYLSYNQPVHVTVPSGNQVYVPSASSLGG